MMVLRSLRPCSITLAVLLLVAGPANAQAPQPDSASTVVDVAAHVREAALRFGIPETWIYAVMRAESAGRIDATSPVGAMGLMQLMPATWNALTARLGLGSDPYEPRANILAGAAYLRDMYDRYGSPGFLAAYNAGPGRYEDYRRGTRALPAETRNYVAKLAVMMTPSVLANNAPIVNTLQTQREFTRQASLFVARSTGIADAAVTAPSAAVPVMRTTSSATLNGLFAPVSGRSSQ